MAASPSPSLRGWIGIMIKNDLDDTSKTSDQLRVAATDAAKKLMTHFALLSDGETVFTELTDKGAFPVGVYQKAGADLLARLGYGAAATEQQLKDRIAAMEATAINRTTEVDQLKQKLAAEAEKVSRTEDARAQLESQLSNTQTRLTTALQQGGGSSTGLPADLEDQRKLLTFAINAQTAATQTATAYGKAKVSTTQQGLYDAVFEAGRAKKAAEKAFDEANKLAPSSYVTAAAEEAKKLAQLNHFAVLALQEREEVRGITGTLSTITNVTQADAAVNSADQAVANAEQYANDATNIDAVSPLTNDAKKYATEAKELSDQVSLHQQSFLAPTSPLLSSSSTSTTTTTTTSGTSPADAAAGGGVLPAGSTSPSSSSSQTELKKALAAGDYAEIFSSTKRNEKATIVPVNATKEKLAVLWYIAEKYAGGNFGELIDDELAAADNVRVNRTLGTIARYKTPEALAADVRAFGLPAKLSVTEEQMKKILDLFKSKGYKVANATNEFQTIAKLLLDKTIAINTKAIDKWSVQLISLANATDVFGYTFDDATGVGIHYDLGWVTKEAIDAASEEEKPALRVLRLTQKEIFERHDALVWLASQSKSPNPNVTFVNADVDDIPDLMAAYDDQPDQVAAAVDDSSDIALTRAADIAGQASSGSMWTKAPNTATAGAGASGQDLVSAALSAFFSAQ